MIGALIGAGLSLAGSLIGSAKTAAANRAARRAANQSLDRQAARNENMYNYSLGTPRYATQTILNQTADVLRDRKAAREGAKNVIGGTQASVQAGNQQDVEMLNNATRTGISQGLDDRKQALQNYTNAQNAIDDKRADVEAGYQQGVAQQTAQAVQGVASAAGSIAGALDGIGSGSSAKTATNTTGATNGGTVKSPTEIAAPTVKDPTARWDWQAKADAQKPISVEAPTKDALVGSMVQKSPVENALNNAIKVPKLTKPKTSFRTFNQALDASKQEDPRMIRHR